MEWPKWPWVEYKFQDLKFFEKVWKLPTDLLNPKSNIIDVIVNTTDIAKIFSNIQKFKTTNPLMLKKNQKNWTNYIGKYMAVAISEIMSYTNAPPSSLINSTTSPRWKQWKDKKLGYIPWLATL
jgi:hypothetical protein